MDTPNANVALSSFDRISGSNFAPITQPYNNFRLINSGGNIVQGQLNHISLTEVSLPYCTPTIITGINDTITLYPYQLNADGTVIAVAENPTIVIPQGFYTAAELVTALNDPSNIPQDDPLNPAPPGYLTRPDVTFTLDTVSNAIRVTNTNVYLAGVSAAPFYYIDVGQYASIDAVTQGQRTAYSSPNLWFNLGMRNVLANYPTESGVGGGGGVPILYPALIPTNVPLSLIASLSAPLQPWSNGIFNQIVGAPYTGSYTDYVDIVSSTLCQAQYVRDTTTTQASRKRDIIARLPVCNNISLLNSIEQGSRPFTIFRQYPVPKVMKWTADRSLDAIDLQLFDMFGQPLPTTFTLTGLRDLGPIPGIENSTLIIGNAGSADYTITFHVHEPKDSLQSQNIGYSY
jgi:hypothetical protein